ncbi:MAG: chromate efflux transporter [Pseudanabaenaceae cyanobacterium bins.68]|nr:chromate efflux transporter [Pseudanabaenaceae cyanobacterium bins.68]
MALLPFSSLDRAQQLTRWRDLVVVFGKLGLFAFGGPAAHIAMIEQEVVQRRQWVSQSRLLDLIGVTNLIPGPNSTELAIHLGLEYGGFWGMWLAGTCFILPAMVMVWILAIIYRHSQSLPQLSWVLYGIKPVIVVIVIQAVVKLGRKGIKGWTTGAIAVGVALLSGLGVNEIGLMILGGLVALVSDRLINSKPSGLSLVPLVDLVAQLPTFLPMELRRDSWGVFLVFLKIGSVLYGGGYVLFAFLQQDLVERLGWLTAQQLIDAIAVGQFTPGPIFTTATFIGYLVAGHGGAIAATVGIFLTGFVLVLLLHGWIERLRQVQWTAKILDGVNAAALGLMAVVTFKLGAEIFDVFGLVVGGVAAIALWRLKLSSIWLIIMGGIIGAVYKYVLGSNYG